MGGSLWVRTSSLRLQIPVLSLNLLDLWRQLPQYSKHVADLSCAIRCSTMHVIHFQEVLVIVPRSGKTRKLVLYDIYGSPPRARARQSGTMCLTLSGVSRFTVFAEPSLSRK